MNFLLSDEQRQLFETVLRFAREQGGGRAARRAVEAESDFDPVFWSGLMELGLAALPVAETDGGAGLEMIDLAIAFEALGRAAAPGPYMGHMLATLAIAGSDNAAAKEKWLPRLMSGAVVGAVALEGPDPGRWSCESGDDLLFGALRNVPGGMCADLMVVGVKGGCLALVETGAVSDRVALDSADRTRRVADIQLNGVDYSILTTDQSFAERLVDACLILLAADAFGGASQCLEMSVDYAKVREQFGQPIGAFQGVKFQLADLAVEIEPARGLYWFAAHAFDHLPLQARHAAAAAKAHVCDVYRRTARSMIELHGGVGYTWEHDAQIYFKRAMFDFAWMGRPLEHRDRQAELARW